MVASAANFGMLVFQTRLRGCIELLLVLLIYSPGYRGLRLSLLRLAEFREPLRRQPARGPHSLVKILRLVVLQTSLALQP